MLTPKALAKKTRYGTVEEQIYQFLREEWESEKLTREQRLEIAKLLVAGWTEQSLDKQATALERISNNMPDTPETPDIYGISSGLEEIGSALAGLREIAEALLHGPNNLPVLIEAIGKLRKD